MTHCLWVSLLIVVSVTLDNNVLLCKAWIQYSGQILIYSKANQSKVVKTGLNSAKSDRKMNTGSNKSQYFSLKLNLKASCLVLNDGRATPWWSGNQTPCGLLLHCTQHVASPSQSQMAANLYPSVLHSRQRKNKGAEAHAFTLFFFFWCVGGW